MKGYVHNIEKVTQQNKTFRTVLYTAKNCQLVVMSLKPGEDIGAEVHRTRISSSGWRKAKARRCSMVLSIASSRVRGPRARRYSPQHHQRPVRPHEALHALCPTEPSRWRSARHQGRCRGRQGAFRREDDRIAIYDNC